MDKTIDIEIIFLVQLFCQPKKSPKHGIQSKIGKMPKSIKTNKQWHQDAYNHQMVTQDRLPARRLTSRVKSFFKSEKLFMNILNILGNNEMNFNGDVSNEKIPWYQRS